VPGRDQLKTSVTALTNPGLLSGGVPAITATGAAAKALFTQLTTACGS
jgi:hypothetical protein